MRKNVKLDFYSGLKTIFCVVLFAFSFLPVMSDEPETNPIRTPFKTTLDVSPFKVDMGSSEDYNFYTSKYDYKNDGLNQIFYKVSLDVSGLLKSNDVTYSVIQNEKEGSIKFLWFNVPSYLEYFLSETIKPVEEKIIISVSEDIVNGVFVGAKSGVISNSFSNLQIYAEFVNNFSETGGAVLYNDGSASLISSTFVGNYTLADGAAIYNQGQINWIKSVFLGNYATNNGGVIYNEGEIERITSDFIGNNSYGNGGVIYNKGDITLISSNFVSNYSIGDGGVIYNSETSLIDTIESTFIDNYSNMNGGAIYNLGTINTIKNSSFIKNHTVNNGDRGGAIYTTSDITFLADGGTIEFTDNYVFSQQGDKLNEAIYVQEGQLSFVIKDGGEVILNDIINGTEGYRVIVNGADAENDTFKLYNQINDAYVNFSNVRLDVLDGNSTRYSFISSEFDNVLFDFDITFDKESGTLLSDVISVDSSSRGVVTLDKVNLMDIDYKTIIENKWTVQLLDTESTDLVLAISKNLQNDISKIVSGLELPSERVSTMDKEISANLSWWQDDLGTVVHIYGVKKPYIGLSDDKKSFGFVYNYETDRQELTDTLAILNRVTIDGVEKTFTTEIAGQYDVKHDLGETSGALTVKGHSSSDSIINLDNNNGFELILDSILTLEDITLKGKDGNDVLITAKNQQAVLNLKDATLLGDITSYGLGENKFAVNIGGNKTTTITGTLNNAVVTLNSGNLVFGIDTFNDKSVSLHAEGGVINLVDGSVNSYDIAELISSKFVDYTMDLQVGTSSGDIVLDADKLNIGKYSLGGAITINRLNFVDELESLKQNSNVRDVVSSIDADIDTLNYVSDVDLLNIIKSELENADDCVSATIQILFSNQAGVETNNLLLSISDKVDNSEIFATEHYRKTDTFEKFKTNDGYRVKSSDRMFDNAYVMAFYRDILLDGTRGLEYVIKSLEVLDSKNSSSLGDILQLALKYNVTGGEGRVFTLDGDYSFEPNSQSVNVSAGRFDITSINPEFVLNFNNKEIVLDKSTQFILSDVKTSNANIRISSSDASLELENVYLNGKLSSDISGTKVNIIGDGTTVLDASVNNITLQLGGDSADKLFNGTLNIKSDRARNLDMVVGPNSEGIIALNDGKTNSYVFNSLNIDTASKTTFGVDVFLNEKVFSDIDITSINEGQSINIADGLSNFIDSDIIGAKSGTGTLCLSNINIEDSLNLLVDYISRNIVFDKDVSPKFWFDVDIIDTDISGNDLKLSLSDDLIGKEFKLLTTSVGGVGNIVVHETTSWDEKFAFVITEWMYEMSINEKNQLHFDISSITNGQKYFDTLYYVNADTVNPEKIFASDSADGVYHVDLSTVELSNREYPKSLGVTKGNLTIKGVVGDDGERSTIYFDSLYGGFTIMDSYVLEPNEDGIEEPVKVPQKFVIDSVQITQAVAVKDDEMNLGNGSVLNVLSSDATIELRDAVLVANNSDVLGGAIYTKSDISIFAENADAKFSGNYHNCSNYKVANDIYFAKDYISYDDEGNVQYNLQNLNLNSFDGKRISLESGIDFDKDTKLVLNINTGNDKEYNGEVYIAGSIGSSEKSLAGLNLNGGTFGLANNDSKQEIYTDSLSITKNTFYNFDIDIANATTINNDKIVLTNKRLTPNPVYNDDILVGYTTLILNKDLMNINLREPVTTRVQVIDMIGETAKFMKLAYDTTEDGNTVTKLIDDLVTGIKIDTTLNGGYDYFVRLGLNGKLIIYNNNSSLNDASRDFLNVIDTYNKKSTSYKLTTNKVIYDYANNNISDDLNEVVRHKELQTAKLTITGNSISTISTPTAMEGITIKGVPTTDGMGFLIAPNKQQLVGKNFTMTGFDGAVRNNGGKVTLSYVNFLGNETEGNGSAIQNVIYPLENITYKGSVSLKGSSKNYVKVNSNVATYDGGAIYNEGSLTLQYVEFGNDYGLHNHALNGGAIANFQTEYATISANISRSRFYYNKADENGGAIYTTGLLKSSKNTFDNNSAKLGGAIYVGANNLKNSAVTISYDTFTSNDSVDGGALYIDKGLVTVSKSNFGAAKYDTANDVKLETGNSASEKGGAIYSGADVEGATSTTIKSSKFYNNIAVDGGAVYNDENSVMALSKNTFGGAVTTKEKINGKTQKVTRYYYNEAKENGGVIYNVGKLTDSGSSFAYNTAINGGAIFNDSRIVGTKVKKKVETDIAGMSSSKFTSNSANLGGAIYNAKEGNIWANKSTFTTNTANKGGAIYNDSLADRVEVPVYSEDENAGTKWETIINKAQLRADSSTFKQNSAIDGGAIYNKGSIVLNKPNFTQNSAVAKIYTEEVPELDENGEILIGSDGNPIVKIVATGDMDSAHGGAIYNNGYVYDDETIFADVTINTATFVGNYTSSATFEDTTIFGYGGAIYNGNYGLLTLSKVTFGKKDSKKVLNSNRADYGGALYNLGTSVITSSTFTNNKAEKNGGGIYNAGEIYSETVVVPSTGDSDALVNYGGIYASKFTSNTAENGGGIYNTGTLFTGRSSFSSNKATENGGAIYNDNVNNEGTTVEIQGSTFSKNKAVQGGAVYNNGTLDIGVYDLVSVSSKGKVSHKYYTNSFTSNSATEGGAIYNAGNIDVNGYDLVSVSSKGKVSHKYYNNSFSSNTANKGGAIYNASTTGMSINYATFTSNKATDIKLDDGTVTSYGQGGAIYLADNSKATITNATFTSNSASQGGAIYVGQYAQLTINDSTFSKNTATTSGGAIFMDENSTVTIKAILKDVTFSGNKVGKKLNSIYMGNYSTLNLIANEGRKITIKDEIVAENSATINMTGEISIVNENALRTQGVNFNPETTVSTVNNRAGVTRFRSLTLDGQSNTALDIDIKQGTSDKIQAETVEGDGKLNVSSVNLVSNSKSPVTIEVGKDSVVNSISTKRAESAEATYKLKSYYDENGLLRVVAYGQKAKPAVLAAPVAAQIGGYLTQINSYDQAFMNMDMNMLKTREERQAETLQNRYALSTAGYSDFNESDNTISYNSKGLWNRPYATFERVNLNNGPKVSNIGYGNYFGGDADMKTLKNGWKRQFSAYIGYNGSVQDYNSQSIDQNGGTVGVTEVWYKNNFFTGLTLNAGANVAQASTDLGRENMPMFMTGIASKSGYNFEFKEGKFIVQPSILLSYSFIHTFSHDNGKGSHVGSSPLNAIQVAPGIKFIANLKNGWQPYLGVNMRWNIIDKTHFSLQDVNIPDMSIDPYVEYGIGLQRRWGERFTGFGQAMIRNGGRNGVMLSFGFKWLIGR